MVEPRSVLTRDGWEAFQTLRLPEITESFYLAGGTGLALHLGHRVSVDFDWFSDANSLRDMDRSRLLDAFRRTGHDVAVLQDEVGTLSLEWHRVVVSFFAYKPVLLEPLAVIDGLPVASVADIAAMKLAAVIGRGGKKDFVDIYYLLQRQPLEHWLDWAVDKYPDARDLRALALRALVYFDDADAEALPTVLRPVDWAQIKSTLAAEVDRVAREYYGLDRP